MTVSSIVAVAESCVTHTTTTQRDAAASASETRIKYEPAIQRVQALADISRSALHAFAVYKAISYTLVCCHSNETRAPIANAPSSAQLEDIHPYDSPKLHPGPCSSECGQRQTDTQAMPHAKCNQTIKIIKR